MANLDETGLELGCRMQACLSVESYKHVPWRDASVYVCARMNDYVKLSCSFGYPHYLHTKKFSETKCVWADVMCQYWPWALSKVDSCPEAKEAMSSQPCLSVMHAKAHSWHCQVS